MAKKILILGATGKMGTALAECFKEGYEVKGTSTRDFDASNFAYVNDLVVKESPDILINTVAYAGIDGCEKDPVKAFQLNALLPRLLAELSAAKGFLLVHFSTDAVFNDAKQKPYVESDAAYPVNTYGVTKYAGDCFVAAVARAYYILRISVLFGPTSKSTQFVEKMLGRVRAGERHLKISGDIVASPTYNKDVALQLRRMIESRADYGLYHTVNAGQASLYDLMSEIVAALGAQVSLERVSHKDFPSVGIKNTHTPLASEKLPALRPWQEAVREYCQRVSL